MKEVSGPTPPEKKERLGSKEMKNRGKNPRLRNKNLYQGKDFFREALALTNLRQ
jgi:hypothetical protein